MRKELQGREGELSSHPTSESLQFTWHIKSCPARNRNRELTLSDGGEARRERKGGRGLGGVGGCAVKHRDHAVKGALQVALALRLPDAQLTEVLGRLRHLVHAEPAWRLIEQHLSAGKARDGDAAWASAAP